MLSSIIPALPYCTFLTVHRMIPWTWLSTLEICLTPFVDEVCLQDVIKSPSETVAMKCCSLHSVALGTQSLQILFSGVSIYDYDLN